MIYMFALLYIQRQNDINIIVHLILSKFIRKVNAIQGLTSYFYHANQM